MRGVFCRNLGTVGGVFGGHGRSVGCIFWPHRCPTCGVSLAATLVSCPGILGGCVRLMSGNHGAVLRLVRYLGGCVSRILGRVLGRVAGILRGILGCVSGVLHVLACILGHCYTATEPHTKSSGKQNSRHPNHLHGSFLPLEAHKRYT